jgi:hypothetical protein
MSSVKVQTMQTKISAVSQRGFSAMLRLGGSFILTGNVKKVLTVPAAEWRALRARASGLESR